MDVTVIDSVAPLPAIITLRGQLDIETAPRMQTALTDLMSRNITRVVIDLSGLTFCDSIGLSTFVLVHRQCADAGGYLRLAEPGPFLGRVLAVLGLDGPIPVYTSLAEACSDSSTGTGGGVPHARRSSDLRRDVYEQTPNMSFADLQKFQQARVKGQNQIILVIGSKDRLNFKELAKYGQLQQLTLRQIFGY